MKKNIIFYFLQRIIIIAFNLFFIGKKRKVNKTKSVVIQKEEKVKEEHEFSEIKEALPLFRIFDRPPYKLIQALQAKGIIDVHGRVDSRFQTVFSKFKEQFEKRKDAFLEKNMHLKIRGTNYSIETNLKEILSSLEWDLARSIEFLKEQSLYFIGFEAILASFEKPSNMGILIFSETYALGYHVSFLEKKSNFVRCAE